MVAMDAVSKKSLAPLDLHSKIAQLLNLGYQICVLVVILEHIAILRYKDVQYL